MIKYLKPSKINTILVLYIVIAFISAFGFNLIIHSIMHKIANHISSQENYYEEHLNKDVEKLQKYIYDNNISINDIDKIENWSTLNNYLYMQIFIDNNIYFDSLFLDSHKYSSIKIDKNKIDEYNTDINKSKLRTYSLQFKDAKANLKILALFEVRFENLIQVLRIIFSAIFFIVIFLLLFRNKLKYIKKIEEGINIIKSGSLEYEIPIKGNDELASLALTINGMSKALNEQLILEENMRKKNNDIITSISHDIRTPLTSVIFYLDLIYDKKYNNQEKLEKYIENARVKAYQIKDLTDDLFTHSIILSEEDIRKYQIINGNEIIEQLINQSIYLLEEKNFNIQIVKNINKLFFINIDILQFRRIFDNISSNIIKYAINDKPIIFNISINDNWLEITQCNNIINDNDKTESFGIGIKNCKKIIENHNGKLDIKNDGNKFYIKILIPIQ